jgi:hypothetical protein
LGFRITRVIIISHHSKDQKIMSSADTKEVASTSSYTMRSVIALSTLLVANLVVAGSAFVVSKPRGAGCVTSDRRHHRHEPLFASVEITNPSQEKATELGIREWPQQLKKGSWKEDGEYKRGLGI